MRSVFVLSTALAFGQQALATGLYGQCGGNGFTGDKNCDAGSVCITQNDWYSQCLPGTVATTAPVSSKPLNPIPSSSSKPVPTTSSKPAVPTTTVIPSSSVKPSSTVVATPKPSTTSSTSSKAPQTSTSVSAPSSTLAVCQASRTKFTYFGVNESGAEFGEGNIPGILGTDYIWPTTASIDSFIGMGLNTFRVPFHWGRLAPNGLTGGFDSAYLTGLKTIVDHITAKGAYAAIEPHNYFRYNNQILTNSNDFATFWSNLATVFKGNKNVIFDLVNEPHDIAASIVASFSQAAINSIRKAGATDQLILVEGTAWTGAWSWVSSGNADAFKSITDPNNNWAVEFHQYLDGDSSGTSSSCVSATIGSERLAAATAWLKANGIRGFLGEMGAASNSLCVSAVQDALCYLQKQGGTWIGATWWAAGPWWHDYMYSAEPGSGPALNGIFSQAWLPFAS